MKKLINKILHPNKISSILIFFSTTILLIYIFANQLDTSLLAHLVYPYSTYALIVAIIKWQDFSKEKMNQQKQHSKIYHLYQQHNKSINKHVLLLGLQLNLLYGVFKLTTGIYYKSWWFITLASYYLFLCFMKIVLVKSFDKNKKTQCKTAKRIGILLILMNLILTSIIISIMQSNQTFYYPGTLIYLVALYDFYLIINAIKNVHQYKSHHEPALIASKILNLTIAMVAMISLEVAMIYTFGNNEIEFKRMMTATLGFIVITINTLMAIHLIYKVSKTK